MQSSLQCASERRAYHDPSTLAVTLPVASFPLDGRMRWGRREPWAATACVRWGAGAQLSSLDGRLDGTAGLGEESSGTITGCTSMLAWNARSHGSTIAGICEASCMSMHSKAVRCPWSSTKETASGLTSARMDWMVVLQCAGLRRPVPGLDRNRSCDQKAQRVPQGIRGAGWCVTLSQKRAQRARACRTETDRVPATLTSVGASCPVCMLAASRPSHGRVCRHMSPVARTVVPTLGKSVHVNPQ